MEFKYFSHCPGWFPQWQGVDRFNVCCSQRSGQCYWSITRKRVWITV